MCLNKRCCTFCIIALVPPECKLCIHKPLYDLESLPSTNESPNLYDHKTCFLVRSWFEWQWIHRRTQAKLWAWRSKILQLQYESAVHWFNGTHYLAILSWCDKSAAIITPSHAEYGPSVCFYWLLHTTSSRYQVKLPCQHIYMVMCKLKYDGFI